jgi:hypothetical protein
VETDNLILTIIRKSKDSKIDKIFKGRKLKGLDYLISRFSVKLQEYMDSILQTKYRAMEPNRVQKQTDIYNLLILHKDLDIT